MSVDALAKLVPPPKNPTATGDLQAWKLIELELKTALPDDYKAYVAQFGLGQINGFFNPFSPFTPNPHLNLLRHLEALYEAERGLLLNNPEASELFPPFPLHPGLPGLLPWGTTDNGEHLFWHTVGLPENWPVIVYSGREYRYETYSMSMTHFLVAILKGVVISQLFPDDISETPVTFRQYSVPA